jgi:hypothetical protein
MHQKIFDKIDSLSTNMDKTKMIFKKRQEILEEKIKEERLAFNSINYTIK